MTIPLLLKIKQGSLTPQFVKSSDTHLQFQNKEYKFAAIYDNDISDSSLDRLTGQTCGLVLMGPTGSGKTTTLRSILAYQIAKCGETHFTACEVSENRAFADIVDGCKRKRYVSSHPMEKQLKKTKLVESSVEKVFSERKTSSTESNATSSRSCLIVTLYSEKNVVTIVDMMGNEKFDAASSTSNVFANSNVSSITQLLLARTTRTRSSNLVTNLIFQKLSLSKMKFILHLDECGSPNLIKSSLYNIVEVVKDFRVSPTQAGPKTSSSSKFVPSYARPTVSSSSPRKKPMGKSIRVTKPKMNVITPLVSRSVLTRNIADTPCVRRKPVNRTMENLFQVELKSLKETNAQLTQTNIELEKLAQESREEFASGVLQLKENLSLLRSRELLPLKESLDGIKNGFVALEKEHSNLEAEMRTRVAEVESLESAKRTAEEKIQQLERAQTENELEISSSNNKAATLQANIESLEQEVTTHKERVNLLKCEAEGYMKLINSLTEDARIRLSTISSLETELESRQKKNSDLERKISTLTEESGSLTSENLSLKGTYDSLKKEVETLGIQLDSLKKEVASLEEQISLLKNQVTSLDQQINSLEGQLAQREQEMKESEVTLQKLKDSHQDERDKKIHEFQVLQQQIEFQKSNLHTFEATIEAYKGQIDSLQSEKFQKDTELSEIRNKLQIQEDATSKWKSDVAIKEERLVSQAMKIQSLEAQHKKEKEALAAKLQWVQKSLDKITAEKDELTIKHNDLISYNKYIVEKYSSALDKNDILNKQEQSNLENTIKDLQAKLQSQTTQQHKTIQDLKDQLESQESEISELEKYKSKCTNLESTARDVRDESLERASLYEQEIVQLKSEIETLKQLESSNKQLQSELESHEKSTKELQRAVEKFNTPSPQKVPFNPSSDIFEDDHQPHKGYLKSLKQSMKSSPKNVLREVNTVSPDKKKLKRRALAYISSGKSPKVVAR